MVGRGLVRRISLRSERGAALIVSLGVLAASGITVASTLAYSTQTTTSALHSRTDQVAYALAEAGLNNALAVLSNPSSNPLDATLLAERSQAYEGGEATWSGTLDRAAGVWTVSARGRARSVSTPGGATRRQLTATVRLTPAPPRPLSNPAWNYIYSTRTGTTCDLSVASRVVVDSPLYSNGNLCLNYQSRVTRGPLVVRGRLTLSSLESSVGSVAAPISEAHVGNGCRYYTYAIHLLCSSVDNVFATVVDQVAPVIAPPVADWNAWYATAAPGPTQPCAVASGTPPLFENETVAPSRNNSVPGVFNLTPPVSYSCRVGPAGAPLGELAWDAATRVLRIAGTVFIDGSAQAANGAANAYDGRGTLYLSGTFSVTSGTKLCAESTGTGCNFASGAWDGSRDLLTVATAGQGGFVPVGVGVQLGSSAEFQGAAFATYAVQLGSGARTQGPLLGSTVMFGSDTSTYEIPELATAPAGMPGDPAIYPLVARPEAYSG